jgi:phosphatidylinositol alpha-mannosyltransferase
VSTSARKVIVEHLGGDAVVIPNGVAVSRYATATPLPGYPRAGGTIGFIGRYDEPRKGMDVLVDALDRLIDRRPDLRLLVAGRGESEEFFDELSPALARRIVLLGQVSEDDKARMLRSVDIYCAPNTGQESFGIILLEALAAGTPIVASDLDAFKQVLRGGTVGRLFPVGNGPALAESIDELLGDQALRNSLSAAGSLAVAPFDWPVIAASVMRVYEVAIAGTATFGGRLR